MNMCVYKNKHGSVCARSWATGNQLDFHTLFSIKHMLWPKSGYFKTVWSTNKFTAPAVLTFTNYQTRNIKERGKMPGRPLWQVRETTRVDFFKSFYYKNSALINRGFWHHLSWSWREGCGIVFEGLRSWFLR